MEKTLVVWDLRCTASQRRQFYRDLHRLVGEDFRTNGKSPLQEVLRNVYIARDADLALLVVALVQRYGGTARAFVISDDLVTAPGDRLERARQVLDGAWSRWRRKGPK